MRDRASRTAEQVALFRALESARPDGRLFDDPYAIGFLTGAYRVAARLARVPSVGRGLARLLDWRYPAGPRGSAVARTRLIDDLVRDSLTAGARQIVLLGAGYDSRAYRLSGIDAARVFEVDHPATQRVKRRLIEARVPADRRRHTTFVPVDLVRDRLDAALVGAGFAGDQRTTVVWEGVTNYLTAEAVDGTVRQLAELMPTGSELIFTYVDSALLDGTGDFTGVAGWQASVRRQGEPWTFGFRPYELERYLAARGLLLAGDQSTREAADRYFAPLGRHEPAAPFYRIARARVR